MTCVEMKERLGAYADGEEAAPGEVSAHLRGCPTCAAELSALRAEIAALESALAPVAVRASAGAERAIAGLPPDGASRRGAGAPWWGMPMAAAAGFLLAAMFLKGGGESTKAIPGDVPKVAADDSIRREVAKLLSQDVNQCSMSPAEPRIKDMGVPAVSCVADWIHETLPTGVSVNRAIAAGILADMATSNDVPLLIGLVEDPDPEVRVAVNRGLERLTGRSAGGAGRLRESGAGAAGRWMKACGTK